MEAANSPMGFLSAGEVGCFFADCPLISIAWSEGRCKPMAHALGIAFASLRNMNPTLRSILVGSASGFVATVPMSAVMLAGLPFFPRSQRRSPPKEITWNMAKAVGLEGVLRHPDRARSHVITTVGHFGYGAAAGALYPSVARR